MKVVKEDENVDLLGNKKMYCIRDKFQLCILSTYTTDEMICRVCDAIPNSEQFSKLIIEK